MSGILGIYAGQKVRIQPEPFKQALGLLFHREPEVSQTWSGSGVILGQTHLDSLSEREQAKNPISDHSSRYFLAYHGVLYNYGEIREELESRGSVFHSQSDAEVILEAYKCWGVKCQEHFNGDWVFTIYDQVEHQLFFSRDRFGIKPAYYTHMEGMFLFASQIKPLLDLGVDSEPDWSEVNRFLQEWSPGLSGRTPFKNIRELPAGHYLLISSSGERLVRWWNISENTVVVPGKFPERVDHFKHLFEDACRLRLKDVNAAGVTLSGGMDSGSIYGAARKILAADNKLRPGSIKPEKLGVYTISYPGNVLDEYEWVQRDLHFWSDENPPEVVIPSVELFPDTVDEVVRYQELPRWSISVMIYHQLYRQIHSTGTRVILEGHGGDELLGGYRDEIRQAVHTYAARGNLLRAWQTSLCLRDMLNLVPGEPSLQAWRIFLQGLRGVNLRFNSVSAGRNPGWKKGRDSLYTMRMKYFQPLITEATPVIQPEIIPGFSPYLQALYLQFTQRYLPSMIKVFYRVATVHSVESRLPFLDHRIVQYAFSLPDEDKVGRRTKIILRQAAADWLPQSVINRRVKTGYNTPDTEWFESPRILNYMKDIFNSRDALQSELFDGRQVTFDLEHLGKEGFTRRDATRIWRVFNIFKWHQLLVEPYHR